MNKYKFEKQLNEFINGKSGGLCVPFFNKFIKNEKKSLFFDRDIEDLLCDNMMKIISGSKSDLNGMINYLCGFDKVKLKIKENLGDIIPLLSIWEIAALIVNDKNELDLMRYINDNFDDYVSQCDLVILFKLYLYVKEFTLQPINIEKVNMLISENPELFGQALLKNKFLEKESDYENVMDVIAKVVTELVEKQDLKYSDIKYLSSGSYSNAFLIGDKVIKIGRKRETHIIPNDKRILKPLIRLNLGDYSNIEGSIEVCNYVNTDINLSDEEMYQLYKELRDRKIICTDFRMANLGSLIMDNDYNWKDELGDDVSARGLIGEYDEKLKSGDIVIIDTDYIFNENDPNIVEGSIDYRVFERRYKLEKKNNNVSELVKNDSSSLIIDEAVLFDGESACKNRRR